MKECAVLFSGGTDSTCAAALCAEQFDKVHLLTFFEKATQKSPIPRDAVRRLTEKYGADRFIHKVFNTDLLVRRLSYEKYIKNLSQHGFFLLSTPGFSSLSWHLSALKYCLDHGIQAVRDGMTKELMHLPGHMPGVRQLLSDFYGRFDISFGSPVIEWDVPPDQRFLDRLIVDRHGFANSPNLQSSAATTGAWLYDRGLAPNPNVKGSLFDRLEQHDCYPYIVYNMFVFWLYAPLFGMKSFEEGVIKLMQEKLMTAHDWIKAGEVALVQS